MNLRLFKKASFTFVCILLLLSNSDAQNTHDEKHIEVSLRMIGHQILLNSGDSTSRVLPIIKSNDRYRIEFESEFEFDPEDLVSTVNRVVKETKLANGYIVEMENCETKEVVYGYEMNKLEEDDIIPCRLRGQPRSCYSLLFTIIGASEAKHDEASLVNYITYILLTTVAIVVFFFLRKKRNKSTTDPNLIPLGEYHFDKQNTELIIEHQRIELTNKEADLLLLLNNSLNTTVEREVILSRVWGDEGDYVGRTLDVFISKLRKKLEADPKVKIVNIRGVGYKLVI